MAAVVTDLYPGFRDRYGERLEPGTLALIEDFLPHIGQYLAGQGRAAHGRPRRFPG